MRKTKLFLLTIFVTIAIMLFIACGGNIDPANKLSDKDAMALIDTYQLSAFNDDFALGVELGANKPGVNLSASLNAQFKRTEDFYDIHAKIETGEELLEFLNGLIEEAEEGEGEVALIPILSVILGGAEVWFSGDSGNFMIKSGEEKGYMPIPDEVKSMLVLDEDMLNIGKLMESVFAIAASSEELETIPETIIKTDGTIDWDAIADFAFSGAKNYETNKTAIKSAFMGFVDIMPIDSNGNLKLSKFFENFTDYTLSYANKKNTIAANLNFDTFIEKFNAVQTALNETNLLGEVAEDFEILKNIEFKFVLGSKFFESIEVSVALDDLGTSDIPEELKGFTVSVKINFTFAKQVFTIPILDGTWTLINE